MRGQTKKEFWHHYIIIDKKNCSPHSVVVERLGGGRRSIPLHSLGALLRACQRGSLLAPALSLTKICSVDMKRALEALLGTGQLHPAIRQYNSVILPAL